jgi:hypothetical protein
MPTHSFRAEAWWLVGAARFFGTTTVEAPPGACDRPHLVTPRALRTSGPAPSLGDGVRAREFDRQKPVVR